MKYSIKPAAKFNSIFSTKSGLPVKDIRFNTVLNVWLGAVSGCRMHGTAMGGVLIIPGQSWIYFNS